MNNQDKILYYLIDYLKIKVKDFKINTRIKIKPFLCPFCKNSHLTANIIPNTNKLHCHKCHKTYGNLLNIVRLLEKDKKDFTDEEIICYIRDLLKLDIKTEKEIEEILNFYEKNNFNLVPVARNQKIPIELDWTNQNHKDKNEWKRWLSEGLNIGVKCGKMSNITIIDIDQETIPKEIKSLLTKTCYQKTLKGHQFIYKYCSELPTTRLESLKIDILNDKKQSVVAPSIVENHSREITLDEIIEMPIKLKEFFKNQISIPLKSFSERLKEDIKIDSLGSLPIKPIGEGNRNNFLCHFGGILRKELNINQTSYVLHFVNKHFCNPPISMREVDTIIGSLNKYVIYDDQELALKILQYLKIVEEAGSRDIKEALGEVGAEAKQRIEKAIQYLVKEGFLIKKRRFYHIIKKADWKEIFPNLDNSINFKLPYFYDVGSFQWGDLILLGGNPKRGKTTISMNFVSEFVKQGIKPYYICLETGSRFLKIALQLGLKEGDFYWDFVVDPTKIELEKNAVTIIDWLLIVDKAMTDTIFRHFVEQLYKSNGFLIVFMQLKENNEYFAPNMVHQFTALSARYLYDKDDEGTFGKWIVDVIREPVSKYKKGIIPCQYLWDEKRLVRLDELKGK